MQEVWSIIHIYVYLSAAPRVLRFCCHWVKHVGPLELSCELARGLHAKPQPDVSRSDRQIEHYSCNETTQGRLSQIRGRVWSGRLPKIGLSIGFVVPVGVRVWSFMPSGRSPVFHPACRLFLHLWQPRRKLAEPQGRVCHGAGYMCLQLEKSWPQTSGLHLVPKHHAPRF